MIAAAKDSAPVAKSNDQGISVYGQDPSKCETTSIPAIKILNDRGEFSAAMGVLPPWLRPVVKRYVPWYSRGSAAVKNLSGLAVAAIAKRLASPAYRTDLLSKLQEGKDEEGNPMGMQELTAEALTQLIAGSDTTSKYVFLLESRWEISFIRCLVPLARSHTISLPIALLRESYSRNWMTHCRTMMIQRRPSRLLRIFLTLMPSSTRLSDYILPRVSVCLGLSPREE
jgi:hypothetical protein